MLIVAVGIVLTGLLVAKIWSLAGRHAADMGSVSHHWVAAHNASERPSE
jgi:hypothetical protein